MTSAICTLFEGHYHYGVGALANSLHKHGFRGTIFAGYRGELPPWALPIANCEHWSEYKITGDCVIRFVELKTQWHLTNYKAHFLLELFAANPELDRIFYFDPDIVIKCPWEFFEEWVEPGVALVEEIATNGMPYNHPLRLKWVAIADRLGIPVKPTFSQYFSGGFIGVRRSIVPYLQDWARIMEHLPVLGIDMSRFMPVDRTHPFCATDQDAMNIFAMAVGPHLSTIGPEGMDFIPGGFTMSHAVGLPKPWQNDYLTPALKGFRPSMAQKEYWKNADGPIPVFRASVVRQRRIRMNLANLIGRFYHR